MYKMIICPDELSISDFKERLFHLSIHDNLEGIWTPRVPIETSHLEPAFPRICCSRDLEKCFYAIYKTINGPYYRGEDYIDFTIYEPQLKDDMVLVVDNQTIVENKMVFDAHMTDEHFIVSEVYMKKIGLFRVYNPLDNEEINFYLFNDKNRKGYLAQQIEESEVFMY